LQIVIVITFLATAYLVYFATVIISLFLITPNFERIKPVMMLFTASDNDRAIFWNMSVSPTILLAMGAGIVWLKYILPRVMKIVMAEKPMPE